MTPEERFDAHEQWLLDHDRGIAEIRTMLHDITSLQQRQAAVLLELTEQVTRLLDKNGGGGR
jgi:hypothetical protein